MYRIVAVAVAIADDSFDCCLVRRERPDTPSGKEAKAKKKNVRSHDDIVVVDDDDVVNVDVVVVVVVDNMFDAVADFVTILSLTTCNSTPLAVSSLTIRAG